MKFKTLIAVAVAAAFPLAALAQGTGGTTTAPSADHPQGNPPYTAPAGSQDDKAVKPDAKSARSKNKDRVSKEEKDAASGTGSTSTDKSGTTGSGAGNMGSGSTGSGSAGTPKSPSSGGPAAGTGSKNSSTDPK